MTTDFTADDEMSSTDDFEAALGQIVLTALRSGIDLRGAWECRTDEDVPDMEVVIFELAE